MKKISKIAGFMIASTLAVSPFIYAQERHSGKEAFEMLRKEADSGNPEAIYRLAYVYDIGYDSIMPDTVQSSLLYQRAAEKGYAPAQNYWGFRLYQGEGVTKDVARGIEWIRKAADAGYPQAWNNLGWLYAEGDSTLRDYSEAARWFEKAAEAGIPTAQAQLADLYKQGKGVETDTLKATRLYEEAIVRGLGDAEDKLLAMNHPRYLSLSPEEATALGEKYFFMGAPKIAATLFEMGESAEVPEALYYLGQLYARGYGVDYDFDKSLEYFYRAALGGHKEAQRTVAEVLDIAPDALEALPTDLPKIGDAQYWYLMSQEPEN